MIPLNAEDQKWLYYTDEQTRKAIDFNLELMTHCESKKGIDSTDEEKNKLNKIMTDCLEHIKLLDVNFWGRLCPTRDEEIVK